MFLGFGRGFFFIFFFSPKKSQAYRTLVCAFLLFGVVILGHPSTLCAQISFRAKTTKEGKKSGKIRLFLMCTRESGLCL